MDSSNVLEVAQENAYERCRATAMARAHALLREADAARDDKQIHSVKSILYAAIERAGREPERLIPAQELVRELITLVACGAAPVPDERHEVFSIFERLKAQRLRD